MAQTIFKWSAEFAATVIDAYCHAHGYQAEVQNADGTAMVPNPLTREQFAHQQIVSDVRKVVTEYRHAVEVSALKASLSQQVSDVAVTVEVK